MRCVTTFIRVVPGDFPDFHCPSTKKERFEDCSSCLWAVLNIKRGGYKQYKEGLSSMKGTLRSIQLSLSCGSSTSSWGYSCFEPMDVHAVMLEETRPQMSPEDKSLAVLVNHCNEMKRRDCMSRFSMAFLLLALTVFIFYHIKQNPSADGRVLPGDVVIGNSAQQTSKCPLINPKAHLTAIGPDKLPKDENILPWQSQHGNAFVKNGFSYEEKALVIHKAGHYYVYLQVTFRMNGEMTCKDRRISQTVIKNSGAYPVDMELMASSESIACVKEPWMKSMYSGAVFYLEEKDKLKVKVNNISLVDFTTEMKTFFGAFLV
ncbi:lymphotoxin-alpha [Amia ocellicauda]|uniref:lymphotoxin-alpha n=1 Tax=Amia ocellicauda TaxID=2972642 RepID=UPI003464BDB7